MNAIAAVYEGGLFRPLEALTLQEGTEVRLSIQPRSQDDRSNVSADAPAAILAEIAALAIRSDCPETTSVDHDQLLYGTR